MKAYASGPNSALASIYMAPMRLLSQKHPRNVQGCMNLILSDPVHQANKSDAYELLKTCSLSAAAELCELHVLCISVVVGCRCIAPADDVRVHLSLSAIKTGKQLTMIQAGLVYTHPICPCDSAGQPRQVGQRRRDEVQDEPGQATPVHRYAHCE